MTDVDKAKRDLAIANRILAHEGVVDALGHASIRHPARPDRFFLSRMRSPELVTPDDIMEFDLDCNPVETAQKDWASYSERFIHGALFQARPDLAVVVHHHAHDLLPFGFTDVKLRPVIHLAGIMGDNVPVWDIRDKFGDTDLLVKTIPQGLDLAKTMGMGNAALMRGHGAVVGSNQLYTALSATIYMKHNAKLQFMGLQMGGTITYLSPGEIEAAAQMPKLAKNQQRGWEYWSRRAGADKLDW